MAPEAPADTAGPSSPPPQLPEGWLPQWEGVGRKWYYVQRTTGKSQWEVPTEPVVLTPSTTPTPMGVGPTQEPRSHPTSNSTRELESVDTTAGGTYSAADSARISVGNRAHYVCSSLDSQIYGQSDNPTYGSSGVPGWYSSQTGQHLLGGYQQQLAANATGYGQNSLQHGPVGRMNGVQQAFYASQTHPGYQMTGPHHMGQNISSSAWGNNPGTYQGHQSGYNMAQHAQSFQGFSADPAGLRNHHQPASWTITSNSQGQMARPMEGASDSQSPWQLESQGHFNASGEAAPVNLHPSTMSKPFFGSYSSSQHGEPSPEEFSRRVSNPSLVQEGQHYQTAAEGFPNHSPHSMVEQGRFGQSQPDPRSHSQHAPTDPALQGFSPLQHVQSQYQQQHMIGKQSGPYQANFAQGHQQYHNPMTQVNANQYVSQHQFGPSDGSTGFSEIGHVHQAPYHQSSHYPEHLGHSLGEAGKDSGSRFVSGPWTSAPPSAGQL